MLNRRAKRKEQGREILIPSIFLCPLSGNSKKNCPPEIKNAPPLAQRCALAGFATHNKPQGAARHFPVPLRGLAQMAFRGGPVIRIELRGGVNFTKVHGEFQAGCPLGSDYLVFISCRHHCRSAFESYLGGNSVALLMSATAEGGTALFQRRVPGTDTNTSCSPIDLARKI